MNFDEPAVADRRHVEAAEKLVDAPRLRRGFADGGSGRRRRRRRRVAGERFPRQRDGFVTVPQNRPDGVSAPVGAGPPEPRGVPQLQEINRALRDRATLENGTASGRSRRCTSPPATETSDRAARRWACPSRSAAECAPDKSASAGRYSTAPMAVTTRNTGRAIHRRL